MTRVVLAAPKCWISASSARSDTNRLPICLVGIQTAAVCIVPAEVSSVGLSVEREAVSLRSLRLGESISAYQCANDLAQSHWNERGRFYDIILYSMCGSETL